MASEGSLSGREVILTSPDDYVLFSAATRGDLSSVRFNGSELPVAGNRSRMVRSPGDPVRVLVVFPSLKEVKNEPLEDLISKKLRESFSNLEIVTKCYNVSDTGQGNQPIHEVDRDGGKDGACERIRCGVSLLELSFYEYHFVLFASVESCINMVGPVFYDEACIVLYEYFTGLSAGVYSRGPEVQAELLDLAFQQDVILSQPGATTYGQILNSKFGVSASEWHSTVCNEAGEPHSRGEFISEAFEYLLRQESSFASYIR